MRRRTLLKGAAALPFLALLTRALPLRAAGLRATLRRVRPADPGWPSATAWRALNDAVGGNLLAVQPLFAPCNPAPASPACQDVVSDIHNPFYISDQPAGTEVSGWLDAWTPAPSVYAVKARHSGRCRRRQSTSRASNKLRLVVKGSGHSYQGTSNAPDSLLIWTRAMNTVTVHDAFVAARLRGEDGAGAGSVVRRGRDVDRPLPCGDHRSGPLRAGRRLHRGRRRGAHPERRLRQFLQGLRHRRRGPPRSRGGHRRRPRAHRERLLGSGAVLGTQGRRRRQLRRGHAPDAAHTRAAGILRRRMGHDPGATRTTAFRRLLARFVDFYASELFNPHWGEQVNVHPGNTLELSMVCQGLDNEQAQRVWQPFFA